MSVKVGALRRLTMDTIPELAKQVEFGGYDVLKVRGIAAHAVWQCPCYAKACRFCVPVERTSKKKREDKETPKRELPLSHAPRKKPMSVPESWEIVL